jgi:dTDP-4-dehydrorhamnose 3,5-epimerase
VEDNVSILVVKSLEIQWIRILQATKKYGYSRRQSQLGKFNFVKTEIEGVYIIETGVFGDNRGYFMETYNYNEFKEAGLDEVFVQDNQSKSRKGVLRGLHFQKTHPQGKLVRVVKGEVFDVAVDIRKDSKTYGKWVGVTLSEENKKQFYIPQGFAHGFVVLSEEAEFCYKCTDFYHPEDEGGILWNDKEINIQWPLNGIKAEELTLSEKDKKWPKLREILL